MYYQTEIYLEPTKEYPYIEPGQIFVVTKGTGYKETNKYAGNSTEITEFIYPSVEEFRKNLIRERFNAEISRVLGKISIGAGIFFAASAVFNIAHPLLNTATPTETAAIRYGAAALFFFSGLEIHKEGNTNKPKVDSRVRAFNITFPDLKPVTFSPRDYLATFDFASKLPSIKLPFIGK